MHSKWISKDNLNDNENEDTVTFDMINVYNFREDLSNGLTGEEMITIPHILALVYKLQKKINLRLI
jgi:CD36 family